MDNGITPEDSLRIQVLLQNDLQAVRLDESFMILYGLTEKGEASIPLSPNCDNGKYLDKVRIILSEHALGTPSGYALYSKRWNRMGQTSHSRLRELLLLGNSEAVMVVANAPNISYDAAEKVWWCATNTEQQAEVARCLLKKEVLRGSRLAAKLVDFLLEYIPFIRDQQIILETVVLILESGISDNMQGTLWTRAQSKVIYMIGFIAATPNKLPLHPKAKANPMKIVNPDNKISSVLAKSFALEGQNFIHHSIKALQKLTAEEIVYPLLNAIGDWFAEVEFVGRDRNYLDYIDKVKSLFANPSLELEQFLKQNYDAKEEAYAACVLAGVAESIAFAAILHSGAVGSQLRKRIKPVTDFIIGNLEVLLED